tara:strand:+ start:3508 stop:3843 length:336 start_codon:yes stop_codon:yes gene_type:complete
MATPEKKVKQNVVSVLTELNAYYFYPATGGYGRSGIPDIVACLDGRFIGIECKAGNKEPTPLQARELQAVKDAGGIAIYYSEPAMDKNYLREIISNGGGNWQGQESEHEEN